MTKLPNAVPKPRRRRKKARVQLRRSPLKRGERIKPKRRDAAETLRIYGPKARREWIKSLPCIACASISDIFAHVTQGMSHNAHTVTGGKGRKAGYETIVPFCASHHRRYDEHQVPFDTPEARDAVKAMAPHINRLWLAFLNSASTGET